MTKADLPTLKLDEGGDILALLDGRMRRIAEEVVSHSPQACGPSSDAEAERMRVKIALIRAKEFISLMEAALLLSCSDGHIRNLVKKARKGEARHPIPFRDLDGVVVFKLDELLAWSEQPKSKPKSLPSSRSAGTLPALPAGPRLPERSTHVDQEEG